MQTALFGLILLNALPMNRREQADISGRIVPLHAFAAERTLYVQFASC